MKIKDKYLLDFLKFINYKENLEIKTNIDNGHWEIVNTKLLKKIGSFNPGTNKIQIFDDEMYEVMLDYLQLGFGHDVFVI